MNKKLYNNTFSNIQYLRIPYTKIGLKLIKYDISLKVLRYKVCSRPAGTQSRRKDYSFRAIRQRKKVQVLRSWKKQQDEQEEMFLHLLCVIW